MDGVMLERRDQVRDLGVILDSKLNFASHVDATVLKAKRMLGLLMRSMRVPACPRGAKLNHIAMLSVFNAHVRSIIEYGSVVWSGAAVTHLKRLERIQHTFLSGFRVHRTETLLTSVTTSYYVTSMCHLSNPVFL